MPTEMSQTFALWIAGVLAPYLQEWLPTKNVTGHKGELIAASFALVVTFVALWATNGFANIHSPAFDLRAPAEFLGYWAVRWTPVLAIQQAVYHKFIAA